MKKKTRLLVLALIIAVVAVCIYKNLSMADDTDSSSASKIDLGIGYNEPVLREDNQTVIEVSVYIPGVEGYTCNSLSYNLVYGTSYYSYDSCTSSKGTASESTTGNIAYYSESVKDSYNKAAGTYLMSEEYTFNYTGNSSDNTETTFTIANIAGSMTDSSGNTVQFKNLFTDVESLSETITVNVNSANDSGDDDEPTVAPTEEPTVAPTEEPTVAPTEEPTVAPTEEPTVAPTEEPTVSPSPEVNPTPTTLVELSETGLMLKPGQSKKVNANTDVTWSSANTAVATVDASGNILGIADGKTTVTAKNSDGNIATVTVVVTSDTTLQTAITELTISKGSSQYISTNKDSGLTWFSSDESVATVDSDGKVTAVGEGQATIIVSDSEGNSVLITVNVTAASASYTSGGSTSGTTNSGSTTSTQSGNASSSEGASETSSETDETVPQTGESAVETVAVLGIIVLIAAAIFFRKKGAYKK